MREIDTELGAKRRWGIAWVSLCLALAVHVVDEALTDFLSLWNPFVQSVRARLPWVPLPTFEFGIWLGGLLVGVVVLLLLSRYIFAGARWMWPISYFFAIVMLGNGLGQIVASVYLGRPAPGVYSSPLLLVAAGFLLAATRRYGAYAEGRKGSA